MWSFYFLAKVGLFFAGYLRFDAMPNVLFLAFTLLPRPRSWVNLRWIGIVRRLLNAILGFLLFWHDSWLPPLTRVFDFLIRPNTAPTPRYAIEFLRSYADFESLALATVVLTACILAQRWHAAMRSIPVAAVAFASISSLEYGPTPVENSVNQFYAAESARIVSFKRLPDSAPPFDIILLHVCSMAWEDLEVAGLTDHAFFRQFDLLFTNFNGVTSYSGISAFRLLRSGCGQVPHGDLFGAARNECYLLDQLRQYGFKTYAAMDHDGRYADFAESVRRLGHIDAPATLEGVPVHQHNFDNSPIFDGYSVLERWWQVRGAEPSAHAVLYYNTITLHEGSDWNPDAGWWDRDRIMRYRLSAERFFDTTQRFFSMIASSGRNVAVILVPEHGTALRRSTIQAPALREIPLPQITRVPVAVKFFGDGWRGGADEQLVVRDPVSYFALASLLARMVSDPPFGPARRGIDAARLPQTRFLAENESFRVSEYNGSYYVSENHGKWHRLADRAVARGAPGERAAR